jgi:hypothetical protein
MSQNDLKNGFEGVRFGAHNKQGILGACSGKMLHLISLGWFKYCLQFLSAQAGTKSQALKDYDVLCAKLGCTQSRQSDRNVPRTNFSQGFSSGSNLMGHEMAGCLFVKLFALHTTCFRSIFNVGKKDKQGVDIQRLCYSNHIRDWIVVVSSIGLAPMNEAANNSEEDGEALPCCCAVAGAVCRRSCTPYFRHGE